MRTLLGMQYGGNVPQQYPSNVVQQYPRQILPPQLFQEGDTVPDTVSTGLARLRRLGKKREARDVFGEAQTEQVGKQKSGSFWGSLLSLAGGAGASWAAPLIKASLLTNPATAAWAIPLLIGGATAAGKYGGEKIGYGGEQDIDMDIMYAKEAGLGDIERAGEEYQSGMGRRAIASGIKAGLTAGFAPEKGNIYKRIAGRESPGKYFNPFEFGKPDIASVGGIRDVISFDEWSKFNPGGWTEYSKAVTSFQVPKLENVGMIGQNPNTLLGYLD